MRHGITDKQFREWEQAYLGYGYGTGEAYICPALHAFFAALEEGRSYQHTILEQRFGGLAAWLLINLLAHADIIEYGTSPRFGWLTPRGTILRDYVLSKTPAELTDIASACEPEGEHACSNNPLLAT
jgi:hypothetical protein